LRLNRNRSWIDKFAAGVEPLENAMSPDNLRPFWLAVAAAAFFTTALTTASAGPFADVEKAVAGSFPGDLARLLPGRAVAPLLSVPHFGEPMEAAAGDEDAPGAAPPGIGAADEDAESDADDEGSDKLEFEPQEVTSLDPS
jgi:hypothetical protein